MRGGLALTVAPAAIHEKWRRTTAVSIPNHIFNQPESKLFPDLSYLVMGGMIGISSLVGLPADCESTLEMAGQSLLFTTTAAKVSTESHEVLHVRMLWHLIFISEDIIIRWQRTRSMNMIALSC